MQTTQPQPIQPPHHDPDEINLIEYIYVLVKNKWWIIGLTFLGLVLGYAAAIIKGPTWVAEVIIAPKERESQKATSLADLGALGGLVASQLNMDVGSASLNMMDIILDGRDFGAKLIEKYTFLPDIYKYQWPKMYAKYWDESHKNWKPGFVKPNQYSIGGFIKTKYLKKTKDPKKNTLSLSFQTKDSAFTYNLSTRYIEYLSEYIKIKVQTEARDNGVYLDSQLVRTVDPMLRLKIIGLLTTEIEKQMIVSREAFKLEDPIYLYKKHIEKRTYPTIFAVGMFILICLLIVFKQAFSVANKTEEDALLLKKIKKELFLR